MTTAPSGLRLLDGRLLRNLQGENNMQLNAVTLSGQCSLSCESIWSAYVPVRHIDSVNDDAVC